MTEQPFGFWTFGGKNGLKGVASRYQELPDGRLMTVKDEENPAVLEDEDILYAIRTSHVAREGFVSLFPHLLPEEQERLALLVLANKRQSAMVLDDIRFSDSITRSAVREGIRLRFVRPGPVTKPVR